MQYIHLKAKSTAAAAANAIALVLILATFPMGNKYKVLLWCDVGIAGDSRRVYGCYIYRSVVVSNKYRDGQLLARGNEYWREPLVAITCTKDNISFDNRLAARSVYVII